MKNTRKIILAFALLVMFTLPAVLTGCFGKPYYRLEWVESMTTMYVQGENVDVTGAVLKYIEGEADGYNVELTEEMVSGFDSSTTGKKVMTITYEKASISVPYEVRESVEYLSIKAPNKLTYYVGEKFDRYGSNVFYINPRGDHTYIGYIKEEMLSGFSTEQPGTYTATVTYGNKTETFEYNVINYDNQYMYGGAYYFGGVDGDLTIVTYDYRTHVIKYVQNYDITTANAERILLGEEPLEGDKSEIEWNVVEQVYAEAETNPRMGAADDPNVYQIFEWHLEDVYVEDVDAYIFAKMRVIVLDTMTIEICYYTEMSNSYLSGVECSCNTNL